MRTQDRIPPLNPDPPLARGIYAGVEVGHQIPEEFFGAVAAVLAFVYRTAARRAAAWRRSGSRKKSRKACATSLERGRSADARFENLQAVVLAALREAGFTRPAAFTAWSVAR